MLIRPLHKDLEFIERSLPMTKNMQDYIWALMSRPERNNPDSDTFNNSYLDDSHTERVIKITAQQLLAEQLQAIRVYYASH